MNHTFGRDGICVLCKEKNDTLAALRNPHLDDCRGTKNTPRGHYSFQNTPILDKIVSTDAERVAVGDKNG